MKTAQKSGGGGGGCNLFDLLINVNSPIVCLNLFVNFRFETYLIILYIIKLQLASLII